MNLYGMHDAAADWAAIIRDAGMSGWAVISEGIGDDPNDRSGGNYTWLAAYGATPIVRLNYSHHGEGTIPLPDRYDAFAARCANFVTASSGCTHWIIANEPNLAGERCQGVPITARQYVDCFKRCRQQIKQRGLQHRVYPAAVAPYNVDTGWCMDYWREMLAAIVLNQNDAGADGLTVHTYSRGPDPDSIYSEDKMNHPYEMWHNGFRAYKDFLSLVPAAMKGLPVYITETDQNVRWTDTNSGWVRNAYQEIDAWNHAAGNQKISCLTLYRWENHDQWGIQGKNGVIDDFRAAVARGYQAPLPSPIPEPPEPTPQPPTPEPTPPPAVDRYFDPALIARGVEIDTPALADGDTYWFADHLEWLDQDESGGRHHIYGNCYDETGVEMYGVRLKVSWPSGDHVIESKPDSFSPYAYNYPMSKSLNEFRIEVLDGAYKSELVTGIGMGMAGNSGIHTSTVVKWKLRTHKAIIKPPIPPDPGPEPPVKLELLLWPVIGPITHRFGEGDPVFGQLGHGGIDISVREGTAVVAIADGEVMYQGWDDLYGYYIRVYHRRINSHSVCAHLSAINMSIGQVVRQGEAIARSGSTGNSTGPHVHFELRGGSRDAYYQMTHGYSQGRYDPQVAYLVSGSPLTPGATH